jgi:predicted ATPase/DNA-binding winged helix-turn-helix (wHTH) protein
VTAVFEIGPFRLDLRAKVVTHDGKPVALGARAVVVLATLVEKANEHVTKAAILDAAWPGLVVEEGNLAVQISAIRKVLARAPGGERWVETLARRGYRFVGPVVPIPEDDAAARGNLPQPLTTFIGREAARESLRALLGTMRLLTIVGTGGIGKTRLALQVAEDRAGAYRDGVWFVDFAPLADAALVPSAIAQAMGLVETPGRPLLQSLCAQLSQRELLIVLDNCEHVLDGAAFASDTLLRNCGRLTILATSREPLHVNGEQAYPLETLTLPADAADVEAVLRSEAGSLFVDRLRRQQPRFKLTAEAAPLVARLCVRLDGIPLALELAAARARSLSLEQIHERLDDRFRLLTGGARTALARQKTLLATLDWSHELLGEEERILLRRCAVFAGGFTIEAAQAVAGEPAPSAVPVADVLASLASRSLVGVRMSSGAARYGMLETTRAYALEHLEASGESGFVRRRHALHYRDAMRRSSEDFLRMPDTQWRAATVVELDNVRAALDWALAQEDDEGIAVALAGASGPLWFTLSLIAEGIERLSDALTREPRSDSDADRARLWLWYGALAEGETAESRAAVERAVGHYRALGEPLGLGVALSQLGRVLATMGQHEAAEAALADSHAQLQAGSTPKAMGLYWGNLGYLRRCQGDAAAGRACYEKAVELHRAAGAQYAEAATIGSLADVAWSQGDLRASVDAFRLNIGLFKRLANPRSRAMAFALSNLSGVLTELGELPEALVVAREAIPLMCENGFAWLAMDHFALRAALAGDLPKGARLGAFADAAYRKRNAKRQVNEARAFARLERLLAEKLAAKELRELQREGEQLDEEAACKLAAEGP